MAVWPKLAWPTVRRQDRQRHALPEPRKAARRALQAARRGISGPRTAEGLARLTAARTIHGKYTKEKRAESERQAEQGRQIRAELKELETWFVDHGHLDKKWWDWFV